MLALCGLFVFCLLGSLITIPEKSNSFLRWFQSLAAYSRNTRKMNPSHPWSALTWRATQFTKEKVRVFRNKFL